MKGLEGKSGVWFVYDGECPICNYAAKALRIKQKFGSLTLLNAREIIDEPLLDEINNRGLDLDEGMVIFFGNQFYHGEDALSFIAKYGETKNAFMSAFKGLFWSSMLSKLMYPWMRGIRNWLIQSKNVEPIDNLKRKKEPTFKSIFEDSWQQLPLVMKKHYANHPYSSDVKMVTGRLDVFCKPPLLWISPVMRLLGQIPAVNEKGVSVTVNFESDLNSKAFHFNRRFNFQGRKPYIFHSKMLQLKGNEVVELMKFGFGWKMQYSWDGEKVILAHKGYVLHFFDHFIPLPLTILMGSGNAAEYPVDDNTFDMEVSITHPWWGEMYGYKGRFEVLN